MRDDEIKDLRDRLVARRQEIEALVADSAGNRATVELDQSSVGRVSGADALQAQHLALAADRRRQQELARIDAALARLADGTFGECLTCGEPIAPKRLHADPTVPVCIDCASAART